MIRGAAKVENLDFALEPERLGGEKNLNNEMCGKFNEISFLIGSYLQRVDSFQVISKKFIFEFLSK